MKKIVYQSNKLAVSLINNDIIFEDFSPKSAVVLALFNDKIVIVKQFRNAINDYSYELPGGAIEENESALEAAKRELREETRLICEKLCPLGTVHSCAHLTNQIAHLFFAPQTTLFGTQILADDEDISIEFYKIAEAFRNIERGRWKNSELAHALLLARLKSFL